MGRKRAYAPEWLTWENTLPISRALPPRPERHTGPPVIAIFENLLHDRELTHSRVAERVGADREDAYSLPARIERDCVGGLQFLLDVEVMDDVRLPSNETRESERPEGKAHVRTVLGVASSSFCRYLKWRLGPQSKELGAICILAVIYGDLN